MTYRSHPFGCLILLALVAAFVPVQSAQALTAEQYFADGNRLFREDLYWAALLRYRQAGEEGLNTPLLHYNMGIAHYRAGQHIRARDSLLKALDDPTIRVAAHYNLGLNAHALGDTDDVDLCAAANDSENQPYTPGDGDRDLSLVGERAL